MIICSDSHHRQPSRLEDPFCRHSPLRISLLPLHASESPRKGVELRTRDRPIWLISILGLNLDGVSGDLKIVNVEDNRQMSQYKTYNKRIESHWVGRCRPTNASLPAGQDQVMNVTARED